MFTFLEKNSWRIKKVLNTGKTRDTSYIWSRGVISVAAEKRREALVSFPHSGARYRSLILGMADDADQFYIDALYPGQINARMVPGETILSFDMDVNNIGYSFNSMFHGLEKYDGFDSLRFDIPRSMKEKQRRDNYRVEPDPENPAFVHLRDIETSVALNISGGGVCFKLGRPIEPGSEISIGLRLPNYDDIIPTGLKVTHSSQNLNLHPKTNAFIISGRFMDITARYAQVIYYYIASRQREIISVFN